MIFVFTLCHGQAQVERGFNINSDLLLENLSVLSIKSQTRLYNFLTNFNSNPHDFVIDDELRKSCVSPKAKYREHCKQKKKEKSNEINKKGGVLSSMEMVKRLKQELHQIIRSLEKDASACYDRAEKTVDTAKFIWN